MSFRETTKFFDAPAGRQLRYPDDDAGLLHLCSTGLARTMTPGVTDRTAIILLNWNNADDTIACADSIRRAGPDSVGIFICDNASTDGSVARIRAWAAALPAGAAFRECTATRQRGPDSNWPPEGGSLDGITLLHTGGNWGFAGGCNVGLRHALAEEYGYFWLLNNDTEIDGETLPQLRARMAADPRIGMCGSTLVYAATPDIIQNLGGGSFSDFKGRGTALGQGRRLAEPIDRAAIEARLRFISGASMLVSRAFLDAVGLMAEEYFLYFEELDWAERARGRFTLGYAPASIVRHKVGASIGTDDFGASSPLSIHYMTRNRLKFCWRFHKRALPFAVLDLARHALRAALRGDPGRAALIARAALGRPMRLPGARPATSRQE